MAKEIEHKNTYEIVCPHCGHKHADSWEQEPDEADMDCGRCEKEFNYNRTVTVDYTTYKT